LSRIFAVHRSAAAGRDLSLIFDHLADSFIALGEDDASALERAANRIRAINAAMERLGRAPFQGTLRADIMPGLRQVTKDSAIFYFLADDAKERIDALAVFFGRQGHQRRMLKRLLEQKR
jgi:toxin ParE1/3/4